MTEGSPIAGIKKRVTQRVALFFYVQKRMGLEPIERREPVSVNPQGGGITSQTRRKRAETAVTPPRIILITDLFLS